MSEPTTDITFIAYVRQKALVIACAKLMRERDAVSGNRVKPGRGPYLGYGSDVIRRALDSELSLEGLREVLQDELAAAREERAKALELEAAALVERAA